MRYYNCKLVCENEIISNAFIEVVNGKITNFGVSTSNDGIDLQNNFVMPGFIDGHLHGALGYDFMDATTKSIKTILSYLPSEGVTSVLATTMTEDKTILRNVVEFIANYKPSANECKVAGIHLEGPFISEKKIGAQNPKHILDLNIDDFEYIRNNLAIIKVVTYAIEKDVDLAFTNHLINLNIRGSIGHSDAKLNCCNKKVGRVTHLYNAMSDNNHRDPGIVTAAYLNKMLCELIVDKVHVHPDVVNLTYQVIGASNIALITDAMDAKALGDGDYVFGGQQVHVSDGCARLANHALAGSTLKFDQGVRNFYEITNCDLIELSHVASINQAKDLNLTTGQIKKGFDADFVVLDNSLQIVKTIIDGKVVYERN